MSMQMGVSSTARNVSDIYVGVNNSPRRVVEAYIGVNNTLRLFYMAGTPLSDLTVGSIVKVKVNGTLRNFIIVHQGRPSSLYDTSCDGTWLLMQDLYEQRQWHSSDVNVYASSTVHSNLNSTFLNSIDSNINTQIIQAKIPYCVGNASGTVLAGGSGLPAKVFLLSGYEVGWTTSTNSEIPVDGAALSYFADIASPGHYSGFWWLRSPKISNATDVWVIPSPNSMTSGNIYRPSISDWYIRPAFILPSTTLVDSDGLVMAS